MLAVTLGASDVLCKDCEVRHIHITLKHSWMYTRIVRLGDMLGRYNPKYLSSSLAMVIFFFTWFTFWLSIHSF